MNICVLSGKGGTGKTTVAVNLARLTGASYIDCDVEEPNGFIFLKPEHISSEPVEVDCPVIDYDKCTLCGRCAKACRFHALISTKKEIKVFPQLCHSCGACELVCDEQALSYDKRRIGSIERTTSHGNNVWRGILDVGEPMGVPVIRALVKKLPEGSCIIDCPPGTSCSVTAAISCADTALLVTEPTLFGLHDLDLAVKLLQQRGISFSVVINKSVPETSVIDDYCRKNGLRIIARIPFSRKAAQTYSQGGMLTDIPEYKQEFENIAQEMGDQTWN